MNNERTIVLENVSTSTIGLADTQGRMYRVGRGGKVRISPVILQDIFDHPGSKIIFKEGMAKVSNVTRNELLGMGLTEAEAKLFIKDELVEEPKEEVVEEPVKEEATEEESIAEPVEEIVEEPAVVEEEKEEPKPAKSIKKNTKKSTKKSSSKRK
jgi:hypothetical protein